MHNAKLILSQRGATIYEEDFNWQTELAQAIGLSPREKREAIAMRAINQAQDDAVNSHADNIIRLYNKMFAEMWEAEKNGGRLPPDRVRYLEQRVHHMIYLVQDPVERDRVMDQVKRRLTDPESQLDREANRLLRNRLDTFNYFRSNIERPQTFRE